MPESEPQPYAIVQGGIIADSSRQVQCIDLDWMDSDDVPEQDELERQRDVLTQAISEGGSWQGELDQVNAALRNLQGDWTFIVRVGGCTATDAARVMSERIDPDEDYGFPYEISWEAAG